MGDWYTRDDFRGSYRERDDLFPFDAVGARRTKASHPYSYDPYFLFGTRQDVREAADGLYSDRIFQWDSEKATACWSAHVGRHNWSNAGERKLSAFLSAYLGKPVSVTALAEGCNVSNGYPYWIVWFQAAPDTSKPAQAPAGEASRAPEA